MGILFGIKCWCSSEEWMCKKLMDVPYSRRGVAEKLKIIKD
jgi:hypothetical protein